MQNLKTFLIMGIIAVSLTVLTVKTFKTLAKTKQAVHAVLQSSQGL